MERKLGQPSMIMRDGQEYRKRQDCAILYPDSYCPIRIDKANKRSVAVPYFFTWSSDMTGMAMKVKPIGVSEHLEQKKLHLFPMTVEHETRANHVVGTLHGVFADLIS